MATAASAEASGCFALLLCVYFKQHYSWPTQISLLALGVYVFQQGNKGPRATSFNQLHLLCHFSSLAGLCCVSPWLQLHLPWARLSLSLISEGHSQVAQKMSLPSSCFTRLEGPCAPSGWGLSAMGVGVGLFCCGILSWLWWDHSVQVLPCSGVPKNCLLIPSNPLPFQGLFIRPWGTVTMFLTHHILFKHSREPRLWTWKSALSFISFSWDDRYHVASWERSQHCHRDQGSTRSTT